MLKEFVDQKSDVSHRIGVHDSGAVSQPPAEPIGQENPVRLTGGMQATIPTGEPPPSAPIGHSETDDQQQGAEKHAEPGPFPPSAAPIGTKPKAKSRKKGARATPEPNPDTPPSSPIGHGSNVAAGGEGQMKRGTQCGDALAATVMEIVELQQTRRFCIKAQSRCDRSIESLIARRVGFTTDMDEKQRKELYKLAAGVRKLIEKNDNGQAGVGFRLQPALAALPPLISASAASRRVWDAQRKEAEKKMGRLAKTLPVWLWAEEVRGIGALGLAILIGEAGIPIGDYRTVSGLWKRLGLAVIMGESQQRKSGDLGILHAFSPTRRAEVWAVCSDSMFRAQWRGDKDEDGQDPKKTGKPVAIPAHPIGPYGEVYARRRAATQERVARTDNLESCDKEKWTKGRAHNDARRLMTKELVKDLWVQWRLVSA